MKKATLTGGSDADVRRGQPDVGARRGACQRKVSWRTVRTSP